MPKGQLTIRSGEELLLPLPPIHANIEMEDGYEITRQSSEPDGAGAKNAGIDPSGSRENQGGCNRGRRRRHYPDGWQKNLLDIKINPEAAGDVEMLRELILSAFREASRKVDEQVGSTIGSRMGGLGLPGLF
jgi:hypothetical protein